MRSAGIDSTLAILFIARPDLLTNPGGDTTQILATREALEQRGHSVTLLLEEEERHAALHNAQVRFDIVHAFNLLLSYQYEGSLRLASSCGIPVVLSPIYWDMEPYERAAHSVATWKRLVLRALLLFPERIVRPFLGHHLKTVRYNPLYKEFLAGITRSVSMLLPNSRAEETLLRSAFQCHTPSAVIVNPSRNMEGSMDRPEGLPASYILCVGRIERRKNQLQLIRALRGRDEALVLLGSINRAESEYWSQCRREARRSGVHLIHVENLPWESVWPYYVHAQVHAQPSWFETPGLSSLEAAVAGCPVVCTQIGSAREYFGSMAEYCDPADVASITAAIHRALRSRARGAVLAAYVRDRYSLDAVGEQTLEAYAAVLGETRAVEAPVDVLA